MVPLSLAREVGDSRNDRHLSRLRIEVELDNDESGDLSLVWKGETMKKAGKATKGKEASIVRGKRAKK